MGFLDRAIRKGLGEAVQTVVTDKVLSAVAPKARENIAASTQALNNAAADLQQAAEQLGMARFCSACGAPLDAGMRFCSSCGTPVPQSTPVQAAVQDAPAAARCDIRADMGAILATDFAAYAVRTGVPASALGVQASPCKPYDYCLYRGAEPAAVIMLTDHNRDRSAAFLNARGAAAQAGVPFINFYTHMPNERGYVRDRIRSFL